MTYPYAENTYVDWDFQEIWTEDPEFDVNEGYPWLRWQVADDIPNPPALAHSPIPEHEAINVPANTAIGWTYSSEEGFSDPHGFILNLWIGDPEGDPYQAAMEGGPGEYYFSVHPFVLDHETSYHWRVIPYVIHEEEQIVAENCSIWSFTTETSTGIEEIFAPLVTKLQGKFPNPFSGETTVQFSVGDSEKVKIEIFNLFGQKVTTLADRFFETGQHEIKWNGTDKSGGALNSGFYFIRMHTADYGKTLKMHLIR